MCTSVYSPLISFSIQLKKIHIRNKLFVCIKWVHSETWDLKVLFGLRDLSEWSKQGLTVEKKEKYSLLLPLNAVLQ